MSRRSRPGGLRDLDRRRADTTSQNGRCDPNGKNSCERWPETPGLRRWASRVTLRRPPVRRSRMSGFIIVFLDDVAVWRSTNPSSWPRGPRSERAQFIFLILDNFVRRDTFEQSYNLPYSGRMIVLSSGSRFDACFLHDAGYLDGNIILRPRWNCLP